MQFGFSGDSDFFKNLGDKIGKTLYIICAALGTVILHFARLFPDDHLVYFLVFSAAMLVMGAVGTYVDQNRQDIKMDELKHKNKELDNTKIALNSSQEELQETRSRLLTLHSELVLTWLKGVAKQLELNSESRVTIYYKHDEEFYLLQRHSVNPTYSKIHKQKFPLNKGVISKAFEHGVNKESTCPHSSEYDKYVNYMGNNYGYPAEKIDALTMKSCSYYARAIIDADINIGVIVFESTETKFINDDLCKSIDDFCDDYQSQLSKFVRDSLNFDREINIKRKGGSTSVEEDILDTMEVKK